MDNPPPIPPRPPGYELSQPPPALPPRQPSYQQYPPPPQPSYQAYQPPPPPPPPPPQQQPSGWSHLVYEDGSPTPLFTSLMNDFFTVLDPQNTGHLTPETFSSFLELNGFSASEDPWRANYKPLAPPWEPIDNADFELKAAYEAWSFPHTVRQRTPLRPLIPHGGMPLLSREGFRDYLAVECAAEGPARVRGLDAALRRYGHLMGRWVALGPMPGWVLPATMPDKVRRRIDEANERSRRTAAMRIEAVRVQHEIQAQGRMNAIELVSDVRYVWKPY